MKYVYFLFFLLASCDANNNAVTAPPPPINSIEGKTILKVYNSGPKFVIFFKEGGSIEICSPNLFDVGVKLNDLPVEKQSDDK